MAASAGHYPTLASAQLCQAAGSVCGEWTRDPVLGRPRPTRLKGRLCLAGPALGWADPDQPQLLAKLNGNLNLDLSRDSVVSRSASWFAGFDTRPILLAGSGNDARAGRRQASAASATAQQRARAPAHPRRHATRPKGLARIAGRRLLRKCGRDLKASADASTGRTCGRGALKFGHPSRPGSGSALVRAVVCGSECECGRRSMRGVPLCQAPETMHPHGSRRTRE